MKKICRLKLGDLQVTIFPKNGLKIGKRTGKGKKRQTGGFLSRYDFAYAGRDVVNQVGKVAPSIINKATSDINKIAQERIIKLSKLEVQKLKESHQKSYGEQLKKYTKHHSDCLEI